MRDTTKLIPLKKSLVRKKIRYTLIGATTALSTLKVMCVFTTGYDFVANDLRASDRPTTEFSTYVNPTSVSVPQFNLRVGWYYKHRWDFSFGYDHMKYVMNNGQNLYLNGEITSTTSSQLFGNYSNLDGQIPIQMEDLHYENTNGLNYISFQLNNTAPLYKTRNRKFAIQRRAGLGVGFVVTQTDFNWDGVRYATNLKVAGYGASLHTGLRFDFFNRFFFQSNWSGGFIHLPKNNTAPNRPMYASHQFVYGQWELLAGVLFYLRTKNGCDTCPDWH